MHIAKWTKQGYNKDILTLTHVQDDRVIDRWQLWNTGPDGFEVRDIVDQVVYTSKYGFHDFCWGWLINKAIDIEKLN